MVAFIVGALAVLSFVGPASAVYHLVVIDEVMTSYNGDASVQFVELRMLASLQNLVAHAVFAAFDANGNYIADLLEVPADVTNSLPDGRWIIGTAQFQTVSGLPPDFIMPAGILPTAGGMVCYGAPPNMIGTPQNPPTWDRTNFANYADCLAYGTYSGATNLLIGTPTPLDGNGHSLQRASNTHSNFADFVCGNPSTPQNNSGASASLPATTPCSCGNGVVTPPEQCDDGNTANGDCCSSTCRYEPNGSSCPDDGNVCTTDLCNATGACVHSTEPRGTCRTAQKGVLVYKDNTNDTKDKLTWKWIKGQATTFAELGLPTGTTAYTLCLYAGTAALGDATVPGNATKWTVIGADKGYKYKDPAAAEDGISKVILKAGAQNKTKVLVKGKGGDLPDLPAMPFTLPVTAQLVNSDNQVCFTSTFTTAQDNGGGQFKAKSP
jgi:cysteine-rich repeat protein